MGSSRSDVFCQPTSNLFGDIISDEGTQLTGTPYLYASAELAESGKGIYTPNQLHHPDDSIIGKQIVNPIGMIAASALMLRHSFGLEEEAQTVEVAIKKAISLGYRTKIWSMKVNHGYPRRRWATESFSSSSPRIKEGLNEETR